MIGIKNNKKTIWIRLIPGSSSDRIGEVRLLADGRSILVVYVTSIAENGKANEAMLRLLAKHCKTCISKLKIIQGSKDRNKLIKIDL